MDYLPEVKDDEIKWALQNPIAISALTLSYGTIYEGLALLFLPEVALPYYRSTLLLSFGLGAYTAVETGKIVGSLAEMIIWLGSLAFGSKLVPRPSIVGQYGGVGSIPKIWWDGAQDAFKNGLWYDTTKPMIALKITAVMAKMQLCSTTSQKVCRLNRKSKLPNPTNLVIDLFSIDSQIA